MFKLRLSHLAVFLLAIAPVSCGRQTATQETTIPPAVIAQSTPTAVREATASPAPATPTSRPESATASPTAPLPIDDEDRPVESGGTDWTQLGYSAQRTSFYPQEVSLPWRVKWIWNGPVDGVPAPDHLGLPKGVQPVTGGGNLYVGHRDGRVRAISEESGQLTWTSADLGGAVINTGAYDASTQSVYFGAQNGKFTMLDARTGESKRVVDLRGAIEMAPLLAGQVVYVGSRDGILYALDKATLEQIWSYDAGAALVGSAAYSQISGGTIILLAEDRSVHAVRAQNGSPRWRVTVNADPDTRRGDTFFADTYPVVSDENDVVIVRSYLDWEKMWQPDGGAPASLDEIREFLTQNPAYQSLFVLDLADGALRYPAPVMVGAIGNGGDFESTPPQVVVKKVADGEEVAYLLWRNRQACPSGFCDGRSDTTFGEMDLTTGDIRFVRDYKDQGSFRLPTDEQSPLSMAGDMLFHSHWQLLGGLKILDRSPALGDAYANPIQSQELTPVLNTLGAGQCGNRSGNYCPQTMTSPGESFPVDPGFYIYYAGDRIYDQYWSTPVRSAVIANGTIYWKSVDGAIIALTSANP